MTEKGYLHRLRLIHRVIIVRKSDLQRLRREDVGSWIGLVLPHRRFEVVCRTYGRAVDKSR